jgi:hypothetical protein
MEESDARATRSNWAKRLNHILVGDYEIGQSGRRYMSLLLLLLATGIGFISFRTSYLVFWKTTVSLTPDLFSGLAAIAILAGLYVRRFAELSFTVYGIVSFVLNVTVAAVLVQALLGSTAGFLSRLPMPFLLGGAVALTWLGIRPVVPVVWALTLGLGIVNVVSASHVMGIWGYVLVLSATLGSILQVGRAKGPTRDEIALHFFGESQPLSTSPSGAIPANN